LYRNTYDVKDTAANHKREGTVIPTVNRSASGRNLATGNRNAAYFCPGARCIEIASARPFNRDEAVYLVATTKYNRWSGNIIEKEECTI